MFEQLGAILFVGLAFLFVVICVRRYLRTTAAKECRQVFNFYPEGKLTEQQLETIRQKLIELRRAYDKTDQKFSSQGDKDDEFKVSHLDVETAATAFSEAFQVATAVIKYFSRSPRKDIANLQEQVWPGFHF